MQTLNVGVLIDLAPSDAAGGHVKVWQRLAHAALELPPDELDLTIHFSGDPGDVELAPHVRLRVHRPVLSTQRLPFLRYVPAHTDLAPHHPALARAIAAHDVLHTTDGCFAFARTAARVARERNLALVNSMHTDNAGYAVVFTDQLAGDLLGRGPIARVVRDRWRLPERAGARLRRRLREHQRLCAHVLASKPSDAEALARELPAMNVSLLRRGIDHDFFHPSRRDRPWLEAWARVPARRTIVLLVGRLDASKNVRVLVDALARLVADGEDVHMVAAGDGPERVYVEARLAARASCLGALDRDRLARVYASSDLFALPSVLDETSNATLEALASGLPVVVSAHSGRLVEDGGSGVVVRGDDPGAWADALTALVRDRDRRSAMGRAARAFAERSIPSWTAVLRQDLLPVWRRVAG